jgi:Predicted transcriptional regulator with C-terminal CBS domains
VFKFPARQRAIVAVIRGRREAAGLSQRALSRKLKEDETYIHYIESLRRDVSVAEFIAIARALEEDPGAMVNGVG